MKALKESKAVLKKLNEALENKNLFQSGVLWEVNCSEDFKKLPTEKRCSFNGLKLYCKWDNLQMSTFPGSDYTFACVCGNVCAIKRREKRRK